VAVVATITDVMAVLAKKVMETRTPLAAPAAVAVPPPAPTAEMDRATTAKIVPAVPQIADVQADKNVSRTGPAQR